MGGLKRTYSVAIVTTVFLAETQICCVDIPVTDMQSEHPRRPDCLPRSLSPGAEVMRDDAPVAFRRHASARRVRSIRRQICSVCPWPERPVMLAVAAHTQLCQSRVASLACSPLCVSEHYPGGRHRLVVLNQSAVRGSSTSLSPEMSLKRGGFR